MNSQLPASRMLVLTLFVSALLLCGASPLVSIAQSPVTERKLTQKTFKNMPVVVHQVKNLHNGENWLRDLEIEVKNVSTQSIYFISLMVEFPDIPAPIPEPREDGLIPARSIVGFILEYGNHNLIDVARLATPQDVALNPGETHVFRAPEERVSGLENVKKRMHVSSEATKNILIYFDTVNFGDGSGYVAGSKISYKKKAVKKNSPKP